MNSEVDVNIIGTGKVKFGLEYRDLLSDQGVCINVFGEVDGEEVELLRFDCFDHEPHYHYGPEKQNKRLAPWATFILDRKPEYLSVILIGTTLSNILTTSFATVFLLRSHLLPHQLIVIPIAVIILLFGEILPKSIMREYANSGLMILSPLLRFS